jgi:tetratricopeptide (TPR) repeat protein
MPSYDSNEPMELLEEAIAKHNRALAKAATGELAEAEELCRDALAVLEHELGERHPDPANVRCGLGEILSKQGRHAEAVEEARRARAILEPILPLIEGDAGHRLLNQALCLEGNCLSELGRYPAAREVLEHALTVARATGIPTLPIDALNGLGIVGKYSGDFETAAAHYAEALELCVLHYGEWNTITATLYHNIGGLAHARGLFADAELPSRRAWEIREQLLGPEHPASLADACAYAGILEGLGRLDEAQAIYDDVLPVYEKVFGPQHYEVAAALHNLGAIAAARGQRDLAEAHYRRALAIKKRLLTDQHPDTALTAANLAATLLEAGESQEAIALLEHALGVFESKLDPNHPSIASTRANLALARG